jgi:hypothetical protein
VSAALIVGFAQGGNRSSGGRTGANDDAHSGGEKPNILFIMGDDIGLMQEGAYHQGWALGEKKTRWGRDRYA